MRLRSTFQTFWAGSRWLAQVGFQKWQLRHQEGIDPRLQIRDEWESLGTKGKGRCLGGRRTSLEENIDARKWQLRQMERAEECFWIQHSDHNLTLEGCDDGETLEGDE